MRDNVRQIRTFLRNHKMNLIPLGLSTLILLYFVLFLIPYAGTYDIFYENYNPIDDGIIYGLLSIPVMVVYIIYIIVFVRKVTFLKSIIYPLITVNMYLGFLLYLIREGGEAMWFLLVTAMVSIFHEGGALQWITLFTILIPFMPVVFFFIWGLIGDIRYYRGDKINS